MSKRHHRKIICLSHHQGAAVTQPFHSSGCFPALACVGADNAACVRSAMPCPTPQPLSQRQRGDRILPSCFHPTRCPPSCRLAGRLQTRGHSFLPAPHEAQLMARARWSHQLLPPSSFSWITHQAAPGHIPVPAHMPHHEQQWPALTSALTCAKNSPHRAKLFPTRCHPYF